MIDFQTIKTLYPHHRMLLSKQINRKIRVLRLLAVVKAYHHYTMMHMNRELMQHENSWHEAENLSHWVSMLLPYKECSPTDFLYNQDELTDTVLNDYDEFKKWVKIAEKVGISEKALTAFCKNVDNLQSVFRLKTIGHIFYPEWLAVLFLYLNDAISKTELQSAFVEYSLFSGKAKPANIATFRKVVLEIEMIIAQIANKQINRDFKSKYRECLKPLYTAKHEYQ